MAKVAVASTDGLTVNEHFGKSKEFLVYEVDEKGSYTFLERRKRDEKSLANIHEQTAKLFTDVEVVLTAQIGSRAEQDLRKEGILAFQVTGPIPKILETYGKREKFIRNSLVRPLYGYQFVGGSGCSGGCGRGCR